MKPIKPQNLDAPGLSWRPRKGGYVAYWVARSDIAKRGYSLKSARVWPPSNNPNAEPDWAFIGSQCSRLQAEMLGWANCGVGEFNPRSIYDGSLDTLARVYLNDPDSPFQALRYWTKRAYEKRISQIVRAIGSARIPELTFRDFKRWHEAFCKPAKANGPLRWARGHGMMTQIRILIAFGALLKLTGCADAKEILSGMEFKNPKKRTTFITAEQVVAFRAEAHRRGKPAVALAQAFMYELMLRQKDVIGEWLPMSEPGISEVTARGKKWLSGIHWKEISETLVLTHRISKSLRGRDAINDPDAGKTETYDLTAYPMIMEELAHVTDRTGPLIKFADGFPPEHQRFGEEWREIADAVGIPKKVQNRDSRAGGVTEAFDAGAPADQVRRHASHSQLSTTMIYSRDSVAAKNNVQALRVKNRPKTT